MLLLPIKNLSRYFHNKIREKLCKLCKLFQNQRLDYLKMNDQITLSNIICKTFAVIEWAFENVLKKYIASHYQMT